MSGDDPRPGAYRPFTAARYPADGHPQNKPEWRVLVHRQHVTDWNLIGDRCGQANARELWEHLTTQPDRPPRLGTVTPMKGRQNAATPDGMSKVYHYEISGGARLDYRYNRSFVAGRGDDTPSYRSCSSRSEATD